MANRFHYFTTRNAEKTSFTAIVAEPVDGHNEFYVAPDLSNVLAMVNTFDTLPHLHAARFRRGIPLVSDD
jgi:hypothetical protein